MKVKTYCKKCGDEIIDGLFCIYADAANGWEKELYICIKCYTKHLMKYYPHSPIIPYEIERMRICGVDVSEFETKRPQAQQPKLL